VNPRLRAAAPVFIGIIALGYACGSAPLAATLFAAALALALAGPRLELDKGRQVLTAAIGAGAGYLSAALLHEQRAHALGEVWTRIAAATLLAAAARWSIAKPRGGNLPSIGLAFAGLVACGRTEGPAYIAFVVLFLLAVLSGFGAHANKTTPARSAIAGSILILAAGLATFTTLGLQRLHTWASTRVRSATYTWQPRVGFSDRMDLGALDGLIDSDEIVLRVRGSRIDYLRGAAFDHYENGRWERSEAGKREHSEEYGGGALPAGAATISAVSERTTRFFLPLESGAIVTAPGRVTLDDFGIVKLQRKGAVPVVHVLPGARQRAELAEPRGTDLYLPRRLRRALAMLAQRWTEGATTPQERLESIARHLHDGYRYARAFERDQRLDPTLDFLFTNQSGHCEYFATALALVARAARIPTRAVMGYRVSERSPFGYFVVREKNAHAWVEAWLPGSGWTTVDATPEAELPQNVEHEASYLTSLADGLSVTYDDAALWLERRTLLETSVAWFVGLLLLGVVVARGARRRKGRRGQILDDEAALPSLELLLTSLKQRGVVRPPYEPLERLAARVPDSDAARLLARYSALRYGGLGRPEELARDIGSYSDQRR
jgi:transglutaminase-like putative cysteine protease